MSGISFPSLLPILLCLLPNVLAAQDAPPLAHAPDGATSERITSILIPTIPRVPFSGKVTLEWERFAADGSRLRTGNERAVARDSQGRVFQERRFIVSYTTAARSPISQVEYEDPAKKIQYICMPAPKVCELQQFQPIPPLIAPKASSPQRNAKLGIAWEDLGTQTIEGYEVQGARETITFAPGTVGNDQPTTGMREYWYSARLGLNLLTIRKDPTTGTQTFRLIDINEQEPDASTFEPPTDYRIIDTRKETVLQQAPQ